MTKKATKRSDKRLPPLVGILMGSESDWGTMKLAAEVLSSFGVSYEKTVVSAHRTPQRLYDYAQGARTRGMRVIIAGAGGAAHLPGMLASMTELPVLGVPVLTRSLGGLDSLYSIVQMPAGVPVATFAIGDAGAKNAAYFAIRILASEQPSLLLALERFSREEVARVEEMARRVESETPL